MPKRKATSADLSRVAPPSLASLDAALDLLAHETFDRLQTLTSKFEAAAGVKLNDGVVKARWEEAVKRYWVMKSMDDLCCSVNGASHNLTPEDTASRGDDDAMRDDSASISAAASTSESGKSPAMRNLTHSRCVQATSTSTSTQGGTRDVWVGQRRRVAVAQVDAETERCSACRAAEGWHLARKGTSGIAIILTAPRSLRSAYFFKDDNLYREETTSFPSAFTTRR